MIYHPWKYHFPDPTGLDNIPNPCVDEEGIRRNKRLQLSPLKKELPNPSKDIILAAKLLGRSASTIYRLIKKGRIVVLNPDRKRRARGGFMIDWEHFKMFRHRIKLNKRPAGRNPKY